MQQKFCKTPQDLNVMHYAQELHYMGMEGVSHPLCYDLLRSS